MSFEPVPTDYFIRKLPNSQSRKDTVSPAIPDTMTRGQRKYAGMLVLLGFGLAKPLQLMRFRMVFSWAVSMFVCVMASLTLLSWSW